MAGKILMIALLLCLGFGFPVGDCAAPEIVKMLRDNGSVKVLEGQTDIDAPAALIWEELTNYGNIRNIMPGYNRTSLLRNGPVKILDIGLKPGGLMPTFRYQLNIREDKAAYHIRLTRVSGDFRSVDAAYRLVPLDGTRTRLLYRLAIDLGNLPVPGSEQVLKSSTEKSLAAMREHCARTYRRTITAAAY